MAKKQEPPKPIFPLKHEFYASLDNFIHQAGMLGDAVRQAIQLGAIKEGAACDLLKERVAALQSAHFGNEDAGD